MKKYKLSQYNVIFHRNGTDYLWNTFSGALIKLDSSAIDYLMHFPDYSIDHPFFNVLLENGCIVDERLDELGKILFDEKAITFSKFPKRLYYTIAPGLSCNYRCEYCFESHRTSFDKMSSDVQDDLFQYICQQIQGNPNLERISVTWFGGEPLLYTDVIYRFSQKIISFCRDHKIDYYSGMITNGRFLNRKNVDLLKKCNLGHLQISIDGMPEYFSRIKGATTEDFEQTINNIVYACNYLPIAIRINVFENIDEAVKLTEYLLDEKGLDGKVKVYIAHTRQYDKNLSIDEEHRLHKLFLQNEGRYMKLFGKGGRYKKSSFEYRIPKRRGTSCLSACQFNSCIGPKGEMYRCEHHFGIKDSIIGNISDGLFHNENNSVYLSFSHYEKCLKCQFFPICLGGCIDDYVNHRDMIDCASYRQRLVDLKMFELEH